MNEDPFIELTYGGTPPLDPQEQFIEDMKRKMLGGSKTAVFHYGDFKINEGTHLMDSGWIKTFVDNIEKSGLNRHPQNGLRVFDWDDSPPTLFEKGTLRLSNLVEGNTFKSMDPIIVP